MLMHASQAHAAASSRDAFSKDIDVLSPYGTPAILGRNSSVPVILLLPLLD